MAKRSKPKVIISCAVTGAIHTPTMSEALPYRPEDIAAQAIEAAEAGAAILHLHARDPETGQPTAAPEAYMRFLPVIKQSCDAVINITTGGGLGMSVEDRLRAPLAAKPEMCSLNMGSMNFALFPLADRYPQWKFDWERPYLANTDDYIFRNTFRDIARIMEILGKGEGVRFEHECYDVGHLYNLAHFVDRKVVEPPFFVQIIFGILGGIGADMRNLMFMKETADRLFGDAYRWSVLGAGPPPASLRHAGGDDGRQCSRRAGGFALYRPRRDGGQQRPAGRQDAPHHRGTRLRGRHARRGARDAGAEGRRQGRVLTWSFGATPDPQHNIVTFTSSP